MTFNLQQNGFGKNRCTNDNLFELTHSIRQNFNKNMISTLLFFDRKYSIKYDIKDYWQGTGKLALHKGPA